MSGAHVTCFRRSHFLLAVGCVAVLSSGCSVKAEPTEMIPEQVEVTNRHTSSVMIETLGTEGDEIVTATLVTANDLATALESAIVKYGVFSTVIESSQADYRLYVEAKVTAPAAGFNMTVRVGGAWTLTDMRTHRVVFDEFVTAQGYKTVGDAFAGMTRVHLAIVEAMRAFIREGLQRLSRLELQESVHLPGDESTSSTPSP